MNKSGVKEALEWLHHVYWIGEFFGSIGLGGILTRLVMNYFHLDMEWKLLIWAALAAPLFILFHFIVGRLQTHRPAQQGAQWLPAAESALVSHDKIFDFDRFLRIVYASPLEPEFRKAVQDWIASVPPKERETALIKFIASGLVAYMHDSTWWLIFKSQVLALDELNKKGVMRKEDLKVLVYDKAATQFPTAYKNDTFDRWL